MALSRSMKNLMHDSAMARRGGGNPNPTGGGMSGMLGKAFQQARARQAPQAPSRPGPEASSNMIRDRFAAAHRAKIADARATPGTGGVAKPAVEPPVPGSRLNLDMTNVRTGGTRGPRGPVMPRGGVMGGPAGRRGMAGTVAGKPRPPGGTFGFASRGGGGTPALQQATAGARTQALQQRAAPRPAGAVPGGVAGAAGRARAAVPAALAQPRGQSVASRIGGQQGPPARRGGMARALGSGGSRRRMLR